MKLRSIQIWKRKPCYSFISNSKAFFITTLLATNVSKTFPYKLGKLHSMLINCEMTNVVGLFKNRIGDLYKDLMLVPTLLQNWKNNIYIYINRPMWIIFFSSHYKMNANYLFIFIRSIQFQIFVQNIEKENLTIQIFLSIIKFFCKFS